MSEERAKTIGQWAQMCAKSITDHLAPKGFSTIRGGVFKGKKKANIEFLERHQVDVAGKIAAGCVGHYRNRLKEYYKSQIEAKTVAIESAETERNGLGWFKFSERTRLGKIIIELEAEISLLHEIEKELDYLTIK